MPEKQSSQGFFTLREPVCPLLGIQFAVMVSAEVSQAGNGLASLWSWPGKSLLKEASGNK
jgi:hypothetical protein